METGPDICKENAKYLTPECLWRSHLHPPEVILCNKLPISYAFEKLLVDGGHRRTLLTMRMLIQLSISASYIPHVSLSTAGFILNIGTRKWEMKNGNEDMRNGNEEMRLSMGKSVQKTSSLSWEIMVLIHTHVAASTDSELFDRLESDSNSESEVV